VKEREIRDYLKTHNLKLKTMLGELVTMIYPNTRSIVSLIPFVLLLFVSACTPNEESNSPNSEEDRQELRQNGSEDRENNQEGGERQQESQEEEEDDDDKDNDKD
jgi:hypothetical protein